MMFQGPRDATSSRLNIKGPKQADAVHFRVVRELRTQLQAMPEGLLELSRKNFLMDQNNRRRNLQDFQCLIMSKLELIIRAQLHDSGEDIRKYRIGGHDGACYERFFRIEPARFMSKAQLFTAMRLLFGDEMATSDAVMGKLFDSFDFYKTDKMDWRAFLFLLALFMQPRMTCEEHIVQAYALYSSLGSFDANCSEKLSLGTLKDILCTPVLLSLRSSLMAEFDQAWQELVTTNNDVLQYTAKKQGGSGTSDPNDFKVPFRFFLKVLRETSFSKYFQVASVFGARDSRSWSSVLEEKYYHPRILRRMKELRREWRNEDEADRFVAEQNQRTQKIFYHSWVGFVKRRKALRVALIAAEIRATLVDFSVYFDHWRKVAVEYTCTLQMQRIVRGFVSRRRREFIKRVKKKVVKMQSGVRQLLDRVKYNRKKMRIYWAAVTIQRVVRGRIARKKVATRVESIFDTEMRRLERRREGWLMMRRLRATIAIQMLWKRYVRRKQTLKRMELDELHDRVDEQMRSVQEAARVAENIYKQKLSKWYVQRKADYDENVFNEQQTRLQKKSILERRNKLVQEEKERKRIERDALMQKVEEERIEYWIKDWEEKIKQRGEDRRRICKRCLILPETPEEVQLKKDLQKRIKVHIKEVLRRADKQKIPMEIPEAYQIATDEIIDQEIAAVLEQAKKDMRDEGARLEEEKRKKELLQQQQEQEEKKRKARWAVVTLQSHMRVYLSRARIRRMAYKRYTKHFDPVYHEYYYVDNRTKQTSWEKPASLGSYDLIMDDYWIVLKSKFRHETDQEPLKYYYHPGKWLQQWEQPSGTLLCEGCKSQFAMMFLNSDQISYCESCFHAKAQELVYTHGVNAKDITFKKFNGGKPDAIYLDVYQLPDENWFSYMMEIDQALRMSEEEEAQLEQMEGQKSKKSHKKVVYCDFCNSVPAEMSCTKCKMVYCEACDKSEHKRGARKHHVRERLNPEEFATLPSVAGGGGSLSRQVSSQSLVPASSVADSSYVPPSTASDVQSDYGSASGYESYDPYQQYMYESETDMSTASNLSKPQSAAGSAGGKKRKSKKSKKSKGRSKSPKKGTSPTAATPTKKKRTKKDSATPKKGKKKGKSILPDDILGRSDAESEADVASRGGRSAGDSESEYASQSGASEPSHSSEGQAGQQRAKHKKKSADSGDRKKTKKPKSPEQKARRQKAKAAEQSEMQRVDNEAVSNADTYSTWSDNAGSASEGESRYSKQSVDVDASSVGTSATSESRAKKEKKKKKKKSKEKTTKKKHKKSGDHNSDTDASSAGGSSGVDRPKKGKKRAKEGKADRSRSGSRSRSKSRERSKSPGGRGSEGEERGRRKPKSPKKKASKARKSVVSELLGPPSPDAPGPDTFTS